MSVIVVQGVKQGSRVAASAGSQQFSADAVVSELGGITITRNVFIAGLVGLLIGAIAKA